MVCHSAIAAGASRFTTAVLMTAARGAAGIEGAERAPGPLGPGRSGTEDHPIVTPKKPWFHGGFTHVGTI